MQTVNVNIETPEIRVDVVQNEPPVVVVNVERQVIETIDAPASRPVSIEAKAGRNGERGERGEKGDKGDAGEPGKDGENGKDGQRGERGEKGDRGDDGADGERGEKGIKGDKGDRGEKGERGEQGKEGKEGQRGRDGKDGAKGEKGDKGEPGERGEKGRDGKDGIGFPGPPGKQGPPGNSAPHTHPLSDIEQSGATDGQVPIWDDGAGEWIPGNAPGGGASIIEKTYAEMAAHIAADELTPGQWYNITDAAGTDLGFICLALTENEISVGGNGGYLNADFQAVGDYSGVAAETGTAAGTQLGIWRTGFEALTIPYTNLQFPPDYVSYSSSSGLLDAAETFTTDLGTTGEVITDDGAGTVTVQNLSQPLVPGEIITGDNSGETVTVDAYTVTQKTFLPGETITGSVTGATAVIVEDDGASSMTAYMTSPGVGFDGSEVLDNGAGVTADMDGAAGTPTIVEGDLVIWNLIHWQLTDATVLDGTDPANNTAAYTELLKAVADVGYVTEWDVSEFDFVNDQIVYRSDLRGNVVTGNFGQAGFQWGNDAWLFNTLQSNANIQQPNLISELLSCFFYSDAYLFGNVAKNNLVISSCIFFPYSGFQNCDFGVGTNISFCQFGSNSTGYFLTFRSNCTLENDILENGAQLTGITAGAGCSISRNKIGQGATMGGSTTMGDGAQMNDLEIRANKQLSNKTLDAGVTFSDKILEITIDGTETVTANIEGNKAQPGFSDIPKSFDLTGLTTLDWLAENNYVGVGNLSSSNATEAIDTISNFPTAFPFLLRPAAGLTLTVTGTAIAGIGAGQIALTTTDVVLDGTNGEWLELEADPSGGGFLREKNRSGTLI